MYETMVSWETVSGGANQPAVTRDFAEIWRPAEKIVFPQTLQTVASARTHIERTFDPDTVRRVKEAAGADITIGGAEPAGQAIAAELVDELHLSSGRSLSVAASAHRPTTSASRPRSRTSAGSETASFTSTTALATDRDDNPALSSHTCCRG
jgi:dihydrofolate reductase